MYCVERDNGPDLWAREMCFRTEFKACTCPHKRWQPATLSNSVQQPLQNWRGAESCKGHDLDDDELSDKGSEVDHVRSSNRCHPWRIGEGCPPASLALRRRRGGGTSFVQLGQPPHGGSFAWRNDNEVGLNKGLPQLVHILWSAVALRLPRVQIACPCHNHRFRRPEPATKDLFVLGAADVVLEAGVRPAFNTRKPGQSRPWAA